MPTAPRWLHAHPDYDRWRALVDDHGLGPFRPALEARVRPSIELDADPSPPPGARSRLGGLPDLPPDLPWPAHADGQPLTFLTQLDLDAAWLALDLEGRLRRPGLLSLFVQLSAPDYAAACTLLWFPPTASLHRRDAPTPRARLEGELALRPRLGLSMSPDLEPLGGFEGLDLDARDAWHDEVWLGMRPDGPHHRLLGWPGNTSWQDDRGRHFVLQIDSDDRVGLEIGDVETLRVHLDRPEVDEDSVRTATCTCDEG